EQPSTIPTEQVEILKDESEGIVPERIEIPAIDVDAPVQHLGLRDNGEMEVPDTLHDTSWYEPGYEVGAPCNAVIAGHVDDTVNPGVFKQLHTLEPGDEIIVHGEDGDTLTFTVYDKELFDADEAPVDKIFGYSHISLLKLITCEGPYDYDVGGTAEGDEAMKEEALNQLSQYRDDFSKFLETATEERVDAEGLQMHVEQLIGTFDAYHSGDYETAYTELREAYHHMFMTGKGLSGAIAMQMPDQFMSEMPEEMPNTALAPPAKPVETGYYQVQ